MILMTPRYLRFELQVELLLRMGRAGAIGGARDGKPRVRIKCFCLAASSTQPRAEGSITTTMTGGAQLQAGVSARVTLNSPHPSRVRPSAFIRA